MLDMGQQDNYYSVENTINLNRNNCYKVKKKTPACENDNNINI